MPPIAYAQTIPISNPAELEMQWSSKGLGALNYAGRNFLLNSNLGVIRANLRAADGTVTAVSKVVSTTVDTTNQKVISTYSWGRIIHTYSKVGNDLRISVEVTNSTASSLEGLSINPINLSLETGTTFTTSKSENIDNLAAIVARTPSAALLLYTLDVNPTFEMSYGSWGKLYFTVKSKETVDFINADIGAIQPGESRIYNLGLGFRPLERTTEELVRPLYENRLKVVPTQLQWADRRPIGSLFLSNSNTKYTTNPRGWYNDPSVNVFTVAGQTALKTRLLKSADSCIANLVKVGAQGVILWDVEGQEMPHPISYLGDPSMVATMAPEMDAVADEFFAKFRNAGLRTGLCIRPSRLRQTTTSWAHDHMGFDPVAQMSAKIAYAKARWGTSLFYIDSNTTYAKNSAGTVISWVMRARHFQQLQALHPDVLLIPEHNSYDYWSATAPYNELKSAGYATPEIARWSNPSAFSVINIADGGVDSKHAALVQAVRNGDVLLFRCWYNDGTHDNVQRVYTEAARPFTPNPFPDPTPTVQDTTTNSAQGSWTTASSNSV